MFEIIKTKAQLNNINPRVENHGDETALACDISLEFKLSNKKLNLFHDALLPCLYTRDANADASDSQVPLDMEEDLLPHLRFPDIGKIPWGYEGAGYTFMIIEDGLNGESVTQISGCKVKGFQIECEEGGTIKVTLKVQGHPSEELIGELCHYIKSDVVVSLIPPSTPEQEEMEMDDEQDEAA